MLWLLLVVDKITSFLTAVQLLIRKNPSENYDDINISARVGIVLAVVFPNRPYDSVQVDSSSAANAIYKVSPPCPREGSYFCEDL